MDRREFLKTAVAVGSALASPRAQASETTEETEFVGVLVDTTRCIGCRSCETACARQNGLDVPDVASDGALQGERRTDETRWTVVNRYETTKGEVFVKQQCMHCWQPACASACLTNAMYKTKDGPVIWREDKCMGCRYCMVSCPFSLAKFEYDKWNPRLQKCIMCYERLEKGQKPACVESCPTDALMFGKKRELVEIARVRIYNHPDKYVHHIYGEHEVGGTGWLYLSKVPFQELGLPTNLGTTPYPVYTKEFLYAVPVVFFGVPALLLGISLLANGEGESEEGGA